MRRRPNRTDVSLNTNSQQISRVCLNSTSKSSKPIKAIPVSRYHVESKHWEDTLSSDKPDWKTCHLNSKNLRRHGRGISSFEHMIHRTSLTFRALPSFRLHGQIAVSPTVEAKEWLSWCRFHILNTTGAAVVRFQAILGYFYSGLL
jgi:hypothetical protein